MDPRRLLILALLGPSLCGCAGLSRLGLRLRAALAPAPVSTMVAARPAATSTAATVPTKGPGSNAGIQPAEISPARVFATMAPIPDPSRPSRALRRRARVVAPPRAPASGPVAIAAANASARETSQAVGFLGGLQVFAYAPGRVYEVWTAPLRVTTLTLSPGEIVVSKAAGDTVRWQIGETASGEGAGRRALVMIKPLRRGLETNLVLATSRRVYLVQLRSGAPDGFNAEVTWDAGAGLDAPERAAADEVVTPGIVTPQGPLDARFRILAKGRRPAWAPTAVMTDGVHTFLTFAAGLGAGETPALVALGQDGAPEVVNYRQQGGLWVVDRVLDAAELRLGGRKAQVVRIERIGGAS